MTKTRQIAAHSRYARCKPHASYTVRGVTFEVYAARYADRSPNKGAWQLTYNKQALEKTDIKMYMNATDAAQAWREATQKLFTHLPNDEFLKHVEEHVACP